MKDVWLPLVPELTAANARQIMNGKVVALAVLDRQNKESFKDALSEMKNAAHDWFDIQIEAFQAERKKLRDEKQAKIEDAEQRQG